MDIRVVVTRSPDNPVMIQFFKESMAKIVNVG